MTGQEENKIDLNKAKENFGNAKQERQRARERLRNSEKDLERVRHDLKKLRAQKRLLENTRDKTARSLGKLAAPGDSETDGNPSTTKPSCSAP